MEKYRKLETTLGSGTFADVFPALDKSTGETVAVKQLKKRFTHLEELCFRTELEFQCLTKLKHTNIVKFKELIRRADDGVMWLVFELTKGDLRRVLEEHKKQTDEKLSETDVRDMCYQILQGLAYMHKSGYLHGDLKPENLLVKEDGVIKIADFGSAREIYADPPSSWEDHHVTTLNYSAPEVLLGTRVYCSQVDMWSMGLIMAELLDDLNPLFPGRNVDDQIALICSVIGSPTWGSWPLGMANAEHKGIEIPRLDGVGLSSWIPSASESAVQLMSSLLSWDPLERPTAEAALQHPFFAGCCNQIPRVLTWRHSSGINENCSSSSCHQHSDLHLFEIC